MIEIEIRTVGKWGWEVGWKAVFGFPFASSLFHVVLNSLWILLDSLWAGKLKNRVCCSDVYVRIVHSLESFFLSRAI